MNRLVLIDGNAVLHRAYHAIPPLTAPDGSVVNAVYGFGTMLLRLIHDLKPTHIAVAFDRPKPTFRKKLFKGYQAKRPKMDEDLVGQIPKVHKLVESLGIPIFEMDGYEADDVIGTLSKKWHDQTIIVTGDRDILQLVDDEHVFVYMPTKGLSQAKLYDEKAVMERIGVLPKLIPDYKALAGDASDNYPGVPGVGPKTAVALLTKHKSLQGIIKAGALSKRDIKTARLSNDLATIRTDVPISGDIAPLGDLNQPKAIRALKALGFRSLLKRITGEQDIKKQAEPKVLSSQQQELFS